MVATTDVALSPVRPVSAAGSGSAAVKAQKAQAAAPAVASAEQADPPRLERFFVRHEHPLGLGSQCTAWPSMADLPEPGSGGKVYCNGCDERQVLALFGDGHLRCGLGGCDYRLCSQCVAKAADDGEEVRRKHLAEVARIPLHYELRDRRRPGVAMALLDANPGAAAEKDGEGRLPLHVAAENDAPLEVVAALLAASPGAAAEKDKDRRLPLHWAAENKARLDVVVALLAANPDAAAAKDRDGQLPLHLAATTKASLEVVAALITANPGAAAEKDGRGRLPLHYSAAKKAPLDVVTALLAANPAAAVAKDKDNRLPLHMAAEYKVPLEVVAALLAANPGAAAEKDIRGWLPLHVVSDNKAPIDVVEALLAANPGAAAEKDKRGRLPIHLAAENKAPLEVVAALLAANPAAAAEKGDKGRLPLHLAAEFKAPLEVVAALLAANPAAATEKDDIGRLPLHLAAEFKAPLEVVAALLAANPAAAADTDKDRRLPLHYLAAEDEIPLSVLGALLAANPGAAAAKDARGWLPLHLLFESKAPLDVVAALLAAHPAAAAEKDGRGRLPLHLAAGNKAPLEVTAALLAANPAAVVDKDKDGRLPLQMAVKNNAPPEVVLALLAANPGTAAEKDEDGRVTLHLAAESKAPLDVVTALLAASPGAAAERDGRDRMPLHVAAAKKAPVEVVKALLAANPGAAAEKDEDKLLPLHMAVENEASAEVVLLLVAANPGAAAEKDGRGRVPLHVAAAKKAPLEVVAALLAANPGAAAEKDQYSRLPLHWAADNKAPLEVVAALLAANPDSLYAVVERAFCADIVFAHVKAHRSVAYTSCDDKGRPAINLATGPCRESLFRALYFLGRYELLSPHNPKHRSATCVVVFALDHKTTSAGGGADGGDGGGGGGGGGKPVALKLMRNRDQFERERAARQATGTAAGTASQVALDGAFVLPLLDSTVLAAGEEFTLEGLSYGYLLVMERADDDLAADIAHARMQVGTARAVARSLGGCLQHMHDRGFCHGDFKPLNAVRVRVNAASGGNEIRWKLIDLDAAAAIGVGYLGTKSSTVYMPPETLFKADVEEIGRRAMAEVQAEEARRVAAAAVEAQQSGGAVAGNATPVGTEMRAVAAAAPAPGAGGWRFKEVDENGDAADPLMRGLFEPLKAHPSFDLWSFGCVLYEMLCRETIWHSDTDDNISRSEEYAELAAWTDAAKRACLVRVPDRWAHALLDRLLAKEPQRRPASMAAALAHPFFTQAVRRETPALAEGLKSHGFLSHFQGNAGPRVMTIKLAVEGAAPGAKLWLDQDQADKTASGMLDGVRSSRFFVLVLTRCYFARWFCQLELREALRVQKPIILIRETDGRHGACQPLPEMPTVRCAKCTGTAKFGLPGALWPTFCEEHSKEVAGCVVVELSPAVSSECLNGSLIYEDLLQKRYVVSAAALELASAVLDAGVAGSGGAADDGAGPGIAASVSWFAELEFRDVSLSKLLVALGMEQPESNDAVAATSAAADARGPGGGADVAQAAVLRTTFMGLSCGVPAPTLGPSNASHVCILSAPASLSACTSLKTALESAFQGAKVLLPEGEAAAMAAAAETAQCVLLFLTVGVLKAGAPQLAALAAALRRGNARIVIVHETDTAHGGATQFGDYVEEAKASRGEHDVMAVFNDVTSIPWYRDPDILPVCALKLFSEGIMADTSSGTAPPAQTSASPGVASKPSAAAAAAAVVVEAEGATAAATSAASAKPAGDVVEGTARGGEETAISRHEREVANLHAKIAALGAAYADAKAEYEALMKNHNVK